MPANKQNSPSVRNLNNKMATHQITVYCRGWHACNRFIYTIWDDKNSRTIKTLEWQLDRLFMSAGSRMEVGETEGGEVG
jgi:hypothetical protein